jgi:hypothetical protein
MAKTAKTYEPKKGDRISLVLASGKATPAQITAVNKDGTVDLEAGPIVITSSPRDDSLTQPDSWAPAVDVTEEPAKEAAK